MTSSLIVDSSQHETNTLQRLRGGGLNNISNPKISAPTSRQDTLQRKSATKLVSLKANLDNNTTSGNALYRTNQMQDPQSSLSKNSQYLQQFQNSNNMYMGSGVIAAEDYQVQ